jgi:hypothetical protein
MRLDIIILGYLVSLLAGLFFVTLYYVFRRKKLDPAPTEDRVFRCSACGYVYTDDSDVVFSKCPHCMKMNEEFRF